MADHWRTPPQLLEHIEQLGDIALDPFPPPQGYRNFVRARTYTRNSLGLDWKSISDGGLVYCNPPYSRSRLGKCMQKMFDEAHRGTWILTLVPASPDVKWFQTVLREEAEQVCFLTGRVRYVGKKKNPPLFPSALIHFPRTRTQARIFERIFSPLGYVVPCGFLRRRSAGAELLPGHGPEGRLVRSLMAGATNGRPGPSLRAVT